MTCLVLGTDNYLTHEDRVHSRVPSYSSDELSHNFHSTSTFTLLFTQSLWSCTTQSARVAVTEFQNVSCKCAIYFLRKTERKRPVEIEFSSSSPSINIYYVPPIACNHYPHRSHFCPHHLSSLSRFMASRKIYHKPIDLQEITIFIIGI